MASVAQGLGTITVEPDDNTVAEESRGNLTRGCRNASPNTSTYLWTPSPSLRSELPPGFELRMCCVTGSDGLRRFHPVDPLETFLRRAFGGGLALLSHLRGLSAEERSSYRVMYFLFWRLRSTRERLTNRLSSTRNLFVARSGRGVAGADNLLPKIGSGDWDLWRLPREGFEEARAYGVVRPSEGDTVCYGLARAA
jgi:hypothetical protein